MGTGPADPVGELVRSRVLSAPAPASFSRVATGPAGAVLVQGRADGVAAVWALAPGDAEWHRVVDGRASGETNAPGPERD